MGNDWSTQGWKNSWRSWHSTTAKCFLLPDPPGSAITDLNACDTLAAALQTSPKGDKQQSFESLNSSLVSVFTILQGADVTLTLQAIAAAKDSDRSFKNLMAKWALVKKRIQNCLGEK